MEVLIRERDKQHSAPKEKSRKPSVDHSNIGGGVTIDQVREIVGEEIHTLRSEILALIDELRALIDKKADADDLWKSEAALLEKLDQVAGALMKRAQADKSDTKKALIFLEKKVDITNSFLISRSKKSPFTCSVTQLPLKMVLSSLRSHGILGLVLLVIAN